jgi:hypothetical protein
VSIPALLAWDWALVTATTPAMKAAARAVERMLTRGRRWSSRCGCGKGKGMLMSVSKKTSVGEG